MIVVLDTSVVIPACFWGRNPALIVEAAVWKKFNTVVSAEIIEEYRATLQKLSPLYKLHTDFVEPLLSVALVVEPVILMNQVSRDPDDDKFIAAALAAKAD